MSKSKVTGKVAAISDYRDKDFYNIALDNADNDDNWYIGDGTLRDFGDIDKGDKVRLHVNQDSGSVEKVDIIGGANEDGGSRDTNNARGGNNGSRNPGEASPLTKQEIGMRVGAAGNQAATVLAESDLHPVDDQGELLEVYGELLNGFYNAMQAQAQDKVSDQ